MYPVRVRADPHTTHPAPSPRTDSRHRRPTVRAHPHTTTPRATQITGPDHRIGHCASESSHNGPQRKHTNQIQPPNPPPCEPILTQRRRHSSHWHHCTVADGRPAHVKSYESRGTYPTTHTTCGTSPQKAQARRRLLRYACRYIHNWRNTIGHNPNHPTSGDSRIPIHTQRAADPRSPSGTLRIQPPAYVTTYTTRQIQPAVTQDHQHPTGHAYHDIRFLRNTLDKTMLPHAYG